MSILSIFSLSMLLTVDIVEKKQEREDAKEVI
jgi:hypothetical protein